MAQGESSGLRQLFNAGEENIVPSNAVRDEMHIIGPTKAGDDSEKIEPVGCSMRRLKKLPKKPITKKAVEGVKEEINTPKTEGHAELYKYICSQHDKYVTSRESIINRLGNVRLLAGILLSAFALSFPVVSKAIEISQGLPYRLVVLAPILTMFIALYHVFRALLSVPKLVGHVELGVPGVATEQLTKVLSREELDLRQMLRQLSKNYLDSIEKNKGYNDAAWRALEAAAGYVRKALFWTVGFLCSTLLVYLCIDWSMPVKQPPDTHQTIQSRSQATNVTIRSKPTTPTGHSATSRATKQLAGH